MTRNERTLLTVMSVGLALLLILRDVAGIGISKFIYLVYIVFFLAAAQYQTMVYMICFMLPLVCGLPGTYIMPCVLALLYIKGKHIYPWQIGMLLFIACMEILASAWYPTFDLAIIIQYVSFAGVVFFLIYDRTALDYFMCVRMYLFGTCVLCGTILATGLMTAPSNWLSLFAEGLFRFGATQIEELEGMKLVLNANSLAYYSITGICCGVLLTEKTQGSKRLLYFAMTVFSVVAGALTVSRSWLLVIVICLFLYVLSKMRRPKRFLGLMVILAILFIGTYALLGGTAELVEGFVTRLNNENLTTGGSRTDIFANYMEVFLNDIRIFFLGSGVTQCGEVTGIAASMHNGTQQVLVCYGLPGFLIYMIALIKPIRTVRKTGKREMIFWLPLISSVLFVQTIQFLNPMMLMLPYIVGIYALKAGGAGNEKLYRNGRYRRGQLMELATRQKNNDGEFKAYSQVSRFMRKIWSEAGIFGVFRQLRQNKVAELRQ